MSVRFAPVHDATAMRGVDLHVRWSIGGTSVLDAAGPLILSTIASNSASLTRLNASAQVLVYCCVATHWIKKSRFSRAMAQIGVQSR